MPRDQIEQNEIDFDQNGSIYPQPKSIFHHFDEEFQKLGDEKPETNVTGGTFAVVENCDAS